MRPLVQPAWLVARRPYQDSGLIIEFFSLEMGRFSAVARGAHRRHRGGSLASLLQPFTPLLVSVSGSTELKSLRSVESASAGYRYSQKTTLCASYLNELLVRLLPRFDPHPTLFANYGDALAALGEGDTESILRRFESQLLSDLGYDVVWHCDGDGVVIDPDGWYRFAGGSLFMPSDVSAQAYAGTDLLAIDQWLRAESALSPTQWQILKTVNRAALAVHLGERPLQSRLLAEQLLSGTGGS
jgi:DNA repair protein RecO (recombination protein O)